jgi:hypothetical protein
MGSYFFTPSEARSDDSREHPVFVSLGMVVLDEIRFPNGTILHDVAGGSGLYSEYYSPRHSIRPLLKRYSPQAHSGRA